MALSRNGLDFQCTGEYKQKPTRKAVAQSKPKTRKLYKGFGPLPPPARVPCQLVVVLDRRKTGPVLGKRSGLPIAKGGFGSSGLWGPTHRA